MKILNKNLSPLLLVLFFLLGGCVQFKKTSLYDGVEPIPEMKKPEVLEVVVEPRIYDEDATDVWGLEKDVCQDVSITNEVAYSGKESIKMTWNREAKGCKWAGIGIGWDGWAGKDLTPIMDYVAIQFYVRTQKGKSFGLPFVLTLIDYSKGMGFSYTTNKYFERIAIDEEWQKVVVPLNSFEMEKENLDPSNIQQLQIELQQSGSFYLDDISLVFYEEKPQTPWMVEEELPDPIKTPIQIFDDNFVNNNAWGLITDDCQEVKLTEQESAEGKKSIHLKWDTSLGNCRLTDIGTSWNKWKPVDLTTLRSTAAFQFDLKMAKGSASSLPIKVGFEDYERAKIFAELKPEFVEGGKYTTEWKKVTVPFSAIPDGLDFTRIKQLYMRLEGSGEVFIDNIKMVRQNM